LVASIFEFKTLLLFNEGLIYDDGFVANVALVSGLETIVDLFYIFG